MERGTNQGRKRGCQILRGYFRQEITGMEIKTKQKERPPPGACLSPAGTWMLSPKATTTGGPQATPPRSANYLPGLILQLARQFQQLATARNKGFWKKDTPTVSQDLDPGPESANPLAHGGSSPMASSGSTNYVLS